MRAAGLDPLTLLKAGVYVPLAGRWLVVLHRAGPRLLRGLVGAHLVGFMHWRRYFGFVFANCALALETAILHVFTARVRFAFLCFDIIVKFYSIRPFFLIPLSCPFLW